ncbi:YkgB family protein [Hymenobacter saemangeumensis]|uniref:YkgB family protein n=1 Tax=Hymenobacter saemangeumensis TaxID=1084522 RepID=UPI0031E94575
MKTSVLLARPATSPPPATGQQTISVLDRAGTLVLRYSLVLIVLWFGLFKFTPTEAKAIQPLFTHSPLFSWLYDVLSVQAVSNLVGTAEILIALLIALRPLAPRLSYLGSLGAVLTFVVTLSFLFTTPGSFALVDGLWVPGGAGGFIIKDLSLLGAALYTAAEARRAA